MIPLKDNLSTRRFPVITYSLILLNIIVFCYELTLGTQLLCFFEKYAVVPALFFSGGEKDLFGEQNHLDALQLMVPLVTSMFLHGGWLHVIVNMLYLLIFGDNVEDRLGKARFLCFYLIAGIVAASAHMIMNSDSTTPSLGASGAVAGVLGAYILLYPRARVLTVLPIFFFLQFFDLPAFFFIGIWIMQQFLACALTLLVVSHQVGGIAWWAHIGGFITGLMLALLLRKPVSARQLSKEKINYQTYEGSDSILNELRRLHALRELRN